MGNSRLDGSVTRRKAVCVSGDNPVVVETRISEGEGDDENWQSPRLGVKGIFSFPFFSLFFFLRPPATRCNIANTSGYIASLALKERPSNRIAFFVGGQGNARAHEYIRSTVARTKMFAQPAINNADGINAHVAAAAVAAIRSSPVLRRKCRQKTTSFRM